jgi:hypothetical protein
MTGTNRLHVVTSFALGLGVGSLVALGLTWQPPGLAPAPTPPVEGGPSEVAARLDGVGEDLDLLRVQLAEYAARVEHGLLTGQSPPARQAVEHDSPPPERQPGEVQGATGEVPGWVGVLDSDLARVLVERGLTPFDPVVGDSLLEAADALRSVESAFVEETAPLWEDFQAGLVNAQEFRALRKPYEREKKSDRKKVVEQLAATLDGR